MLWAIAWWALNLSFGAFKLVVVGYHLGFKFLKLVVVGHCLVGFELEFEAFEACGLEPLNLVGLWA